MGLTNLEAYNSIDNLTDGNLKVLISHPGQCADITTKNKIQRFIVTETEKE